ncbi:hypothetical protein GUJ93_ZPchr0010g10582 [Zizania palustris]|uniref:Auxin response factor domain-containing protein n=1 Tax=Zizania palustris TaxID=103762 RepID=A0A8J5WFQ0_ZIZPA|nr:hypothetical protein GUJ93_ZPchr0010g10582 [Zizania palustris]
MLMPEPKQNEMAVEKTTPTSSPTPARSAVRSFCKTPTASDTSPHGGFSVLRRHVDECLPPLDMTQSPPTQELVAKDLHGMDWWFRHIFRGQALQSSLYLMISIWSPFEGEEALEQRFTGTIVGSENLDPLWPESSWRSLKVRWDELSNILRPDKVSPWKIEPASSPPVNPLPLSKVKRPRPNAPQASPESHVLTKEGVAAKVDIDSAQAQRSQNNMVLQGQEQMTLRNSITDSNDFDATVHKPIMWSPSPNAAKPIP